MIGKQARPAMAPGTQPPWRERLRGSFAHTGRALALVWRSSPGGTVALAVLTVVAAGLYPASAFVGKLIIDAVVAARAAAPGAPRDAATARAIACVLLEL